MYRTFLASMICLVGLLTTSVGTSVGADPDDMHWPTNPPAAATAFAAGAAHESAGTGADARHPTTPELPW